jgi:hypothetical protein
MKKKVDAIDSSQRSLNRIMESIDKIPEPTCFYNIGDDVEIGGLKNCKILDIIEDGKIYKTSYINTDNNYGRPIKCDDINYWKWTDISPAFNEDHKLIKNNDYFFNYTQRNIEDLFSKKYFFGLEMNPEYQREYVWELSDKVLLIDSIFNNMDIGKFVFIQLKWKHHPLNYAYEILDGKQRVNAICDFFEGRFTYNGLLYKDLSKHERNHFKMFLISVAEIEDITREQKLQYFLRLNRTGKIMSEDQLNKVRMLLEQEG